MDLITPTIAACVVSSKLQKEQQKEEKDYPAYWISLAQPDWDRTIALLKLRYNIDKASYETWWVQKGDKLYAKWINE